MNRAGALLATCLLAASAPALAGCSSASTAASSAIANIEVAAASNPVAVSPMPGTLDASSSTQISFLGPRGTRVSAVRVVGTRSGPHRGVLRPYSTRTGESFLPAKPFLPGEQVSVRASVSAGDGASRSASTSFTVARQAAVNQAEFPATRGDPRAVQRYSSAPTLTPSAVTISRPAAPTAAPGYLFLGPYQGAGSAGPMIVDQRGALVWFKPLPPGVQAANFGVQSWDGKPALVWWQGRILEVGFGQGEDVIYDSSYHRLARIRAGNGYSADLHEIRLTPEGTAWIDTFDPIHMNLSKVHGIANGILLDCVVQQVDVRTGLVMWEWHTLGHVLASESQNPNPNSTYPWDYAHLNSIDPGSSGDVLVSLRNTWALYDIDIRSGGVRWRLGGNRSSFTLAPAARFYWQHDAELQPGGQISIFDNASEPPKEPQSRGLLLTPDASARTVAVVHQYANPAHRLLAGSQGNMVALAGGNWLIGYGGLPNFTEFDSAGNVVLDGTLGAGVQSFTADLSPWQGLPGGRPSLAVAPAAGGLSVAASWNGATQVASWRVLAGSSPVALRPAAAAPKSGFETALAVRGAPAYVAVQALDRDGAVISTSRSVRG